MNTFTLDTSGFVSGMGGNPNDCIAWRNLWPFVQDYVEAMFAERMDGAAYSLSREGFGFRHLDPSALALILRDCEAAARPNGTGADFWNDRQAGHLRAFPPLRLYLSEEGRVCLRPAEQTKGEF